MSKNYPKQVINYVCRATYMLKCAFLAKWTTLEGPLAHNGTYL